MPRRHVLPGLPGSRIQHRWPRRARGWLAGRRPPRGGCHAAADGPTQARAVV